MNSRKISLREIQYLIANKPLSLVSLEHSNRNKKLVIQALSDLSASKQGKNTLGVLKEFLRDRAPQYNLNRNQDGLRCFLLREMERIGSKPREVPPSGFRGLLASMSAMFKFV